MIITSKYCWPWVLVIILWGCQKDPSPVNFQYEYFSTQKNHYIIYDATDIRHDISSDTLYYQLKVVIGETFLDDQQDTAQKVYRYIKTSDTSNWTVKDVWWRKIVDRKAIQYEENTPFVKMVFRPEASKSWDGNAQNEMTAWEYRFEDIHQSKTFNGVSFDSTLVVHQRDFKTLVDYQDAYEIYAKNVGMVKKYYKNLVIENFDSLQISTGNELYLNYVEHGTE